MKNLVRLGVKSLLLAGALRPPAARAGVYFLIYHSVSGQAPQEVDVPFPLFRRQMRRLAETGRVISFDQAVQGLRAGDEARAPQYVLTFDDGYSDFYTHVFPVLQDLQLPAIVYITTGFIEEGIPYPVGGKALRPAQPLTWTELGEMVDSGLVQVGAHTHTHPNLPEVSDEQREEELAAPRALIRSRLALEVEHFCYPRADWDRRCEAAVQKQYRTAVIGEGRPARAADFHPHRIPRIPIRRSDGWAFFLAKIQGRMFSEDLVYGQVRRLIRRMAK